MEPVDSVAAVPHPVRKAYGFPCALYLDFEAMPPDTGEAKGRGSEVHRDSMQNRER